MFYSKCNPVFYCYKYILIGRLSVTFLSFLIIYLKWPWISDTENDPSEYSNLSLHVGSDNSSLLLLYGFLIISYAYQMLRFHKAIYLSLLLKCILSTRLSNSLWASEVLLFLEYINILSLLFHNVIKIIILLYKFLVISFTQYKEYLTWKILFSKFSDVLPAFTYACTIGSLWSICSGVTILRPSPWIIYTKPQIEEQ